MERWLLRITDLNLPTSQNDMKKLISIQMDESGTQDHKTEIYIQDNLWYYQTDKGQEVGPFRYKSEAQTNLTKLLSELKQRLDADPE